MATDEERVAALKKEICDRLRELREGSERTLEDVVRSLSAWDKGYLSKVERGLENPTLDFLCEVIVLGLETDFATFCRYWAAEDKKKDREERTARQLLEQLLREGPAVRKKVIGLLSELKNPDDAS